jgi:hypothetical protein
MSSPKKRARRELYAATVAEPGFIDRVCDLILDRNTLDGVAKQLDVPYFVLHKWIHDDSARVKQYAAALEARNSSLSETVIGAMMRTATADIRQLYDADGRPIDPQKLPDSMADVLTGVKDTRTELTVSREYKLADRNTAQANLARVLGMFKDKLDLNVSGSLAARMDAAARRKSG